VEAARNNQDWDKLLDLLRDRPHPYPPDRVAFLRASCWKRLGDLETSLLFLQKAVSLSPTNAYYLINLMSTLLRVGRPTEAISIADRILDATEILDPDPMYMTIHAPVGSIQALGDCG
jgi:tetratricopeptide (TPR) repeat protein